MNLKDEYNKTFVEKLASEVSKLEPNFKTELFVKSIINKAWEEKELKARMRFITNSLHQFLPFSYQQQVELLRKVAPNYSGLQGVVFPDFIQIFGLNDFKTSMSAIEEFTQYSTAEFAIRPFIEAYPKEAIQQLLVWSNSENFHVRRLASEGSRPKLPWATPLRKFIADPSPVLPILENLKDDGTLYVRKSVANHLNDISKSQPELVLDIAKRWIGVTKNTDWIVKHGLRTLLKKGDKRALAIFKLDDASGLEIKSLSFKENSIKIGDDLFFSFEISNQSNQERSIRLEYKIAYVKANGTISKKVFKITEFTLGKKESKFFTRKQRFTDFTTRKHYPGEHEVIIVVNGEEKCKNSFRLSD
ncbi:MAG: DNA alkylation repair protein [Flavobacteriales bacterium]|nr:DNA alkylation repair protein [Flavobacteriales bacterium]MCB9365340.1 DNA alkylation repair protein [Flavobacteriales bacterium]